MNPITPIEDPRWGALAELFLQMSECLNHALIVEPDGQTREAKNRVRARVAALVSMAADVRKEIKATCEPLLDELVWETTNTDADPARVGPREARLQTLFVTYSGVMVIVKAHAVATKYKQDEFGELAANVMTTLLRRFTRPTRARPAQNQECDPVRRGAVRKPLPKSCASCRRGVKDLITTVLRRDRVQECDRVFVSRRPRKTSKPLPKSCASCRRGVKDLITTVLRRDSALARDIPTADKLDGYIYRSVENARITALRTKKRDAVFAHLEAGAIEQASSSAVVSRSMQLTEIKREKEAAKKAATKKKAEPPPKARKARKARKP